MDPPFRFYHHTRILNCFPNIRKKDQMLITDFFFKISAGNKKQEPFHLVRTYHFNVRHILNGSPFSIKIIYGIII